MFSTVTHVDNGDKSQNMRNCKMICTSSLLSWLLVPNIFELDIGIEVYVTLNSFIYVVDTVTKIPKRSGFLNISHHITQFISIQTSNLKVTRRSRNI